MISKRLCNFAILASLACVSSADAFTFGNFGGFGPQVGFSVGPYRSGGPYGYGSCHRPWTYAERYYFTNRAYPKYYHGFHASYFQTIGLPPGDIGLRSNGIHPTAW